MERSIDLDRLTGVGWFEPLTIAEMELGVRVTNEQYAEDTIDIVALLVERFNGARFEVAR